MTSFKNPPAFNEGDDYDVWKRDIELWTKLTELKPEKQAIAVHLSLNGKARQASSELKVSELDSVAGIKTLMTKLDKVFQQDANWKTFNTYLAFENFRRH